MLRLYTILYYNYLLNDNHRFQQEASKWQDVEAQDDPRGVEPGGAPDAE
jgi:hypothetical protein